MLLHISISSSFFCHVTEYLYAWQDSLVALSERLIKVRQNMPVSHIAFRNVLDSFGAAGFADWNRLNPALDVLLCGDVKHGNHLRPIAEMRGTEVSHVAGEIHGVEFGKRLGAKADAVEFAHDFESGEVIGEVEFLR